MLYRKSTKFGAQIRLIIYIYSEREREGRREKDTVYQLTKSLRKYSSSFFKKRKQHRTSNQKPILVMMIPMYFIIDLNLKKKGNHS